MQQQLQQPVILRRTKCCIGHSNQFSRFFLLDTMALNRLKMRVLNAEDNTAVQHGAVEYDGVDGSNLCVYVRVRRTQ